MLMVLRLGATANRAVSSLGRWPQLLQFRPRPFRAGSTAAIPAPPAANTLGNLPNMCYTILFVQYWDKKPHETRLFPGFAILAASNQRRRTDRVAGR